MSNSETSADFSIHFKFLAKQLSYIKSLTNLASRTGKSDYIIKGKEVKLKVIKTLRAFQSFL